MNQLQNFQAVSLIKCVCVYVCVCVLGMGRGWQGQKCYHTDNGVFFASPIMFWILTVQSGRVPTRTGKPGKPGKMGRHFPVREKSGNFEQTGKLREKSGKITQNTGKLREFEINII